MSDDTPMRQRAFAVVAEQRLGRAEGDDTVTLSFSSEQPVERYDYEGRYLEVLDHSRDAIDLSFTTDGLPLLLDHDVTRQIGLVSDLTLGSDRRLRGVARFSTSPEAQQIKRDMLDGIRTKVSVGYRQGEYQPAGEREGVPVRRYKWMPMEASSVAVPADYTVGVNRSAEPSRTDARAPRVEIHSRHSESPMQTNSRAQDYAEIKALAEALDMADAGREAIARGMNLEQARNFLDERIPKSQPIPSGHEPNISPKERRSYSVARAVGAQLGMKVDDGYEREVSQDMARTFGRAPQGVFMPFDLSSVSTRATLTSSATGAAKELIFTQSGEPIDLLRPRSFLRKVGATFLDGLTGPVSFPRQTAAGTAYWNGENPGSDVTGSNQTVDLVTLSPKTAQSMTLVTRQLLVQSLSGRLGGEEMIRKDLAAVNDLLLNSAAVNGSGSSNQPKGILNTSGIGSVAIGTNGGAPAYANLVDVESAVANVNADGGTMAFLTSSGVRGTLRKAQEFPTSANGLPVWKGGIEGDLLGYNAYASNAVPTNLVKGTSSDCVPVIFGDWSSLIVGSFGAGFDLVVDNVTLAAQGVIRLITFQMVDIQLRHPESFAAIKDARAL